MLSDRDKTRRKNAARLLLCCLCVFCAGIILFQGADALRGRAVATVRITHQEQAPIRSLPDTEGKTDINLAGLEDLQKASGIGPVLAQRILDERDARGGFHFIEELMDVSGIGEKRFEALSALFYCPTPDAP
ncbi:MAG: helix-hairpin-helix domain-containing protein [Clostridia bacterium]|nr:helix-hairpin-helix domain-containing protein [Clostridia bacterium]